MEEVLMQLMAKTPEEPPIFLSTGLGKQSLGATHHQVTPGEERDGEGDSLILCKRQLLMHGKRPQQ